MANPVRVCNRKHFIHSLTHMIGLSGGFEGHQQKHLHVSKGHVVIDLVKSRINILVGHRNLAGNCQKLETQMVWTCQTSITAFQKKSFLTSWRRGITGVGRGNPGHAMSRSGRRCPCQKCSQQLLTEKENTTWSAPKVHPDASLKTNNACMSNINSLQSPPRRKP